MESALSFGRKYSDGQWLYVEQMRAQGMSWNAIMTFLGASGQMPYPNFKTFHRCYSHWREQRERRLRHARA